MKLPAPRVRRRRRPSAPSSGQDAKRNRRPLSVGDVPLREVVVRPMLHAERKRWEETLERYHYLGANGSIGERIHYLAELRGEWLALLSWSAAALKSRPRDEYIGWNDKTRFERLALVANNTRFLVLPWVRVPHLASRVLSQNLRRLSGDWERRYAHPILMAETFIDLERFSGTCYRAANWRYLGKTLGMRRKGRGYEAHGERKALFVYELHRRARELLSAPFLSPEIVRRSEQMPAVALDLNKLPLEGQGSLVETFRQLRDPRKARGIRHPFESVLTLSAMAVLSGMRSYEAIAEWARDVPKELLKKLRCWCHRAPSEATFRRVFQVADVEQADRILGEWLAKQAGSCGAVALDGKTLRGSRDRDAPACHLLAAVTHETGLVLGQRQVEEKSNEITGAAPLLEEIDIEGKTVTADAMHTQRNLARYIVEEKKADYVFVAKANQPTLREDIGSLHWESFSPSSENLRQGARPSRGPEDLAQ